MSLLSGLNATKYSTYTADQFIGNGSQTIFTLSKTPPSPASLIVTIDGVKQHSTTYSVGTNQITFSEAPPSGGAIECVAIGSQGVAYVPADDSVSTQKISNGSVTKTKYDVGSADGTGSMNLPAGTSAQRTGSTNGAIRFNTEALNPEVYDTTNGWRNVLMPQIRAISSATYDATSLGAVTSITDFETAAGFSSLPSDFYLRYNIKTMGMVQTIQTRVKKYNGQLCQSAFRLGATFLWNSPTYTMYSFANDDMDSLVMQGDGTGCLGWANSNDWSGNNWARFVTNRDISGGGQSTDNTYLNAPSGILAGTAATLIAFPSTGYNLYFSQGSGNMRLSGFGNVSIPATIQSLIGTGNSVNSIMTLSDGVNCFLIYRWGATSAGYIEMNLDDGTVYKYTTIPFSCTQSNTTEEDCNGTQLFAIDAAPSYIQNGGFYWGSATGWRWGNTVYNYTYSSTGLGANTQTDMDLFGSIDPQDNSVWFADWGHDDGGFFGVGNDVNLGVRKTNIYLITPQ